MSGDARIGRRTFLRAASGAVAGLVIGFALPVRLAAAEDDAPRDGGDLPEPNAFLRIAPDGTVTLLLAHSEMGQGIWTTLPMLVAEELDFDWSKIRCEHAPADVRYAHTSFGMQMTGGSTTTWSEFDRYRQVGAMARDMLVRAAAARMGVEPATCRVENGFVLGGDRRVSFGEVAADAEKLTPPTSVTLKERGAWRVIGRPTKRLDAPEKVTGRALFGQDVTLPGLKIALVARSPVFGGRVRSFRGERASGVPGVRAVVEVPSGVAVVADHFWAAKLGRDALEIEWDLGAGADLDSGRLREEFRRLASTAGAQAAKTGDVASELGRASRVLEAEYELPYLAHACMEPMNCTVRADASGCEIWAGTQFQTVDQKTAADILGLRPEQVRIHTTFLGGGFGRRATATADVVAEAVHVAKACGMPVKVIWTREDDMRGGYYRPAWLHRLRASLDGSGGPSAWHQTIVGQSIAAGTPFEEFMVKDGVDATSVEGASDSPYVTGVPHHLVDLHSPRLAVPVLWWRSVGHSHTAFVVESFVDELAHAAGADPLAYRRRLLAGHPRHLGALDLAAAKAGWDAAAPAGRARGIAVHESFGSFVAFVVEVSVENDQIRVHRAVAAIDCGTCVNPAGVAAQLEGATAFALSAALFGELTLREGRVRQSNFHDYPMLRIAGMPRVETHIVPSDEKPGGVGEPGVPPVAPAVANAVFAATGKRLRRLPLILDERRRR